MDAFYLPTGEDTFHATPSTASPWEAGMQHGGPPLALLGRAVLRTPAGGGGAQSMPLARITCDILGPIPQGEVRTEARVVRPGRRVQLVEATLSAAGRTVVRATAWRIRRDPGSTVEHATPPGPLPPVPGPAPLRFVAGADDGWGYGRSVDWRFVEGGPDQPGPGRVWTRLDVPLVEGEEPTPTERLLAVADSANGVSGSLPLTEWWFIPPTVTVTFQRPPTGEWHLLEAVSTTGPDGTGLSEGRLSDQHGLVATVAQPLLVARR